MTAAAAFCLIFGPSTVLVSGFGVFVYPLAQSFKWGRGQIGFAVSLISLTLIVVSPLQGLLIDRYGTRRVILWSIPAFSAGLFSMRYLGSDLSEFYLRWVLLTVLAVGIWPGSYLKAVSTWFDERLGLATGVANAGIGVGVILLPPITAALIAYVGWRAAFTGLSGLAFLTWPAAACFVREAAPPDRVAARSFDLLSMPALLASKPFRAIAAGYFLIGIAGTGLVAGLVPMLIATGLRPATAVATMSLFGTAALAGRLMTGWMLDRLFLGHVMNAFAAAAAIGALGFAGGITGIAAICAVPLLGLLMGAEFDVLAYAIRRYFGLPSFGRVYGTTFGIFQCGAAVGAALLSVSVQRFQSYRPGMALFSCALFLTIPIFGALKSHAALPRLDCSSSI